MANDPAEALLCKVVPVNGMLNCLLQKWTLVSEIVAFSTFRKDKERALFGSQSEFIIQGTWLWISLQ